MPGYFAFAPRPIAPEDAAGAHQLLVSRLGVTPYIDRAIEILTLAERGDDPEHCAFKLHSLVVELPREGDVGERLLAAVASAIGASGGRFVIAELADEPALTTTIGLLRDQGFAEVGRIPDYYRDGVALTILRRDL